MNEENQPPTVPPSPTQESSTTIETVEWFDSIQTPQQKPKKKHIKLLIIALALVLLGVSGGVAWTVLNQGPSCLTTDDLQSLLGRTDVDNVTAPSESFFSYPVEFFVNSASYDVDVEQTGQQVVQQISSFYEAHPKTSILLTISSEYYNVDDKTIAEQRISRLKSDLLATGIPESSIVTQEPMQNDPESDTEQATTATIDITSDTTCK